MCGLGRVEGAESDGLGRPTRVFSIAPDLFADEKGARSVWILYGLRSCLKSRSIRRGRNQSHGPR